MRPISTVVPVGGTCSQNTVAQFARAKIASDTSLPTLRLSTSHAATIYLSRGRYPAIYPWMRPIATFAPPLDSCATTFTRALPQLLTNEVEGRLGNDACKR